MPPALAGGFLTTAPPGKSQSEHFFLSYLLSDFVSFFSFLVSYLVVQTAKVQILAFLHISCVTTGHLLKFVVFQFLLKMR